MFAVRVPARYHLFFGNVAHVAEIGLPLRQRAAHPLKHIGVRRIRCQVVELIPVVRNIVELLSRARILEHYPPFFFQFARRMEPPHLLHNRMPIAIRNPEQIRLFGVIIPDVFIPFIPHGAHHVVRFIIPVAGGEDIFPFQRPRTEEGLSLQMLRCLYTTQR